MTMEKKLCAVCAWRRNCKKKFSSSSGALFCSDFTKDLSIKDEPEDDAIEEAVEKDSGKKKDHYWKW